MKKGLLYMDGQCAFLQTLFRKELGVHLFGHVRLMKSIQYIYNMFTES